MVMRLHYQVNVARMVEMDHAVFRVILAAPRPVLCHNSFALTRHPHPPWMAAPRAAAS
jgi:hypothetical protein